MHTLTVRQLDDETYLGLKEVAEVRHTSMEAQAREVLRLATRRLLRWRGATLADLSGPEDISDLETPFVRSTDTPRAAF
ncbi:MAG: hypothetical protein LBR21_03270 [Propionibacteriaceae bacterium]|nr:hypothetical protein [Propionibacteriaceae bacterium]